jgi:hydrogenase maturation protease
LKRTLILGWGNPDREDDGVAWHVMKAVAEKLHLPHAQELEDGFEIKGGNPDFLFVLQLTPELADDIARYERVCFVDAHTGEISEEVAAHPLESEFQRSPFTHHMTPSTVLSMAQVLCGCTPEAQLVSVRGYAFGFSRSLSSRTAALVDETADQIVTWLEDQ